MPDSAAPSERPPYSHADGDKTKLEPYSGGWVAVMSLSAEPNFDSLATGQQIIDLNAEVYREVKAGRYHRAAELRDQRVALESQLNAFGNPIVVQNVRLAVHSGPTCAPVLNLLEEVESAVDPEISQLISIAALPPRWLINNAGRSCRASVAKRLNIDSLDSPHFQALLPVFSSSTLDRATNPMNWLTQAITETARASSPVVWIVEEPAYLAERGVLDIILQVLSTPATQFVVCLLATDGEFHSRFSGVPGVSEINAGF